MRSATCLVQCGRAAGHPLATGELFFGCAGGGDTVTTLPVTEQDTSHGLVAHKVRWRRQQQRVAFVVSSLVFAVFGRPLFAVQAV